MQTTATINFKKVPVTKPKKEPKAAFKAVLESALLDNSPKYAPTKGPIIIPNGIGAISPIIKPSVVPIIPDLLPPNLLVPIAGMMQSKAKIDNATIKVIIKKDVSFGTASVININNKPIQLKGGPGKIGKMLPTKPNKINAKPIMVKKISISFCLYDDYISVMLHF